MIRTVLSIVVLILVLFPQPSSAQLNFLNETVDAPGNVGGQNAIARGTNGALFIAYVDVTRGELQLASKRPCDGWHIESVEAGGTEPSIKVDRQGQPHVAYVTSGGVKYGLRTGSGWQLELVDVSGVHGVSLALDGQDNPHMSYITSSRLLRYAAKSGSAWASSKVDTLASDYSSLAIDSQGNKYICYQNRRDNSTGCLGYAYQGGGPPGPFWFKYVADAEAGGGYNCVLALDSNNRQHMCHLVGGGLFHIRYVTGENFNWTFETVSRSGGLGMSIAVTSLDSPRISFTDQTQQVYFATRSNGTWDLEVVAPTEASRTSLVLDAQDKPNISYNDIDSQDLRFASVPASVQCDVVAAAGRTWASIAFPLTLPDPSIERVLVPTLGAPTETTWKMGHWDPAANSYLAAGAGLASLVKGHGYWFIAANPSAVRTVGVPEEADPFEIPLSNAGGGAPGWNQLGNPYEGAVPVSSLLVKSGIDGTTWSIADPANPLTDTQVTVWTTNYEEAQVIPGFAAFWVRKIGTEPGRIVIPRPIGVRSFTSTAQVTATALPGIGVTARQAGQVSNRATFGVTNAAVIPRPVSLPPSPSERVLRVAILEDGGGLRQETMTSYRAQSDHMAWKLTLSGGDTPGEVFLDLSISEDFRSGWNVRLLDPEADHSWAVRDGEALKLAASRLPRALMLLLDRKESVRADASQPQCVIYPNPSTGPIGILFRVNDQETAEASIYDVGGRLVRRLSADGSPGENLVAWDRRDRNGRSAAAGIYFVRWKIGGSSGMERVVLLR